VIGGFRSRSLERLFRHGDRRRVSPTMVGKIERILARLDEAAGFRTPAPEGRPPSGGSCFASRTVRSPTSIWSTTT